MVKLKENDPHKYGWTIDEYEQKLLRVVRAAGKLIAIAPENDLYYALNKYCCEHMDEMIKALEALPEHLRDA